MVYSDPKYNVGQVSICQEMPTTTIMNFDQHHCQHLHPLNMAIMQMYVSHGYNVTMYVCMYSKNITSSKPNPVAHILKSRIT